MTDSANKGFNRDPLAWMEDASVDAGSNNSDDPTPVTGPQETRSGRVLQLEPMLTIQGVTALHSELCGCLAAQEALEINASAVESVDTACLQLLIVTLRQARAEGLDFNLTEPSGRFLDCVRTLGVASLMGLANGNTAEAGS